MQQREVVGFSFLNPGIMKHARALQLLLIFTASLLSGSHFVRAQEIPVSNRANNLQYGVSARLVVDVPWFTYKGAPSQPKEGKPPRLWYRLSITGGVSSNFAVTNIHPSLHGEFLIYNGGLGSQQPKYSKGSRVIMDFIWGMTMTAGFNNLLRDNDRGNMMHRNVPLYFFSNFAMPPLQNPFDCSVSIGTNLIFTTDWNRRNQRVGFLNGHVGPAQISYYNDGGPPIYQAYLGDRRDRYYTGGLLLSYHAKKYNAINLVEVAFQKFTGYTNNAFEACNEMDFSFVNYKDTTQNAYNKSVWTFSVSNPEKFIGGYVALYNYDKLDIQHWLHRVGSHSYHTTPAAPFFSVGVSGFYSKPKTYLR
jgi:hypothetical protein